MGTTKVPFSPRTSSSAKTTASAPPQTKPSELREECTRRMELEATPSEWRSEASDERVHRGPAGGSVFCMIPIKAIHSMFLDCVGSPGKC